MLEAFVNYFLALFWHKVCILSCLAETKTISSLRLFLFHCQGRALLRSLLIDQWKFPAYLACIEKFSVLSLNTGFDFLHIFLWHCVVLVYIPCINLYKAKWTWYTFWSVVFAHISFVASCLEDCGCQNIAILPLLCPPGECWSFLTIHFLPSSPLGILSRHQLEKRKTHPICFSTFRDYWPVVPHILSSWLTASDWGINWKF